VSFVEAVRKLVGAAGVAAELGADELVSTPVKLAEGVQGAENQYAATVAAAERVLAHRTELEQQLARLRRDEDGLEKEVEFCADQLDAAEDANDTAGAAKYQRMGEDLSTQLAAKKTQIATVQALFDNAASEVDKANDAVAVAQQRLDEARAEETRVKGLMASAEVARATADAVTAASASSSSTGTYTMSDATAAAERDYARATAEEDLTSRTPGAQHVALQVDMTRRAGRDAFAAVRAARRAARTGGGSGGNATTGGEGGTAGAATTEPAAASAASPTS
jgi:phage shock protein A